MYVYVCILCLPFYILLLLIDEFLSLCLFLLRLQLKFHFQNFVTKWWGVVCLYFLCHYWWGEKEIGPTMDTHYLYSLMYGVVETASEAYTFIKMPGCVWVQPHHQHPPMWAFISLSHTLSKSLNLVRDCVRGCSCSLVYIILPVTLYSMGKMNVIF